MVLNNETNFTFAVYVFFRFNDHCPDLIVYHASHYLQLIASQHLRHVTAYFESKVYPTSKIGNGNPLKMHMFC